MSRHLHPRVHLIVGLLISLFSAYTLMFTDVPSVAAMQLFLFIGIGFIALAFIKWSIRYYRKGGIKADEKGLATNLGGVKEIAKADEYQQQVRRQAQLQRNQQQANRPQVVYCQLCGTKNYITSNYCHMCGYKLK